MTFLDDLRWVSIAGTAPQNPDRSDLDVAAVIALRRDVREAGEAALSAIDLAKQDRRLSPEGKADAARRLGLSALANIAKLATVQNSRKVLAERIAATSIPTLDSVPQSLVPLLYHKLAAADPTMRFLGVREAAEGRVPCGGVGTTEPGARSEAPGEA